MKLKKKFRNFIIIILVLVLVAVAGLLVYKSFFSKDKDGVKEVKVVDQLDKYGYVLKETKPKAYKDLFNELKEILNAQKLDEKAYAAKIAEMFIYDFYSLDDKTAKTDIGGVDFVYKEVLPNFLQNAQNTYYKYVENNIYGNRNQALPIVKDIVVGEIKEAPFAYGNKNDEQAYSVPVTWDYTNTIFSTYQKSATLIFIHDENKLSLVELQ